MSDVNNKLLEMYLANGATSKNISMAERECLISQGAADGTWYSYLASQGYTGSVNDMMYKFLGDKGYTAQGLNERWYQGAVGGGLFAPPAFDWTQFFGVSDDGFVFDGTQSKFYTDSAMTTECASAGSDPVGAVEDISGKGNHLIQTTSGNKPVYYSNNGKLAIQAGMVSGVVRGVYVENMTFPEQFTRITVARTSPTSNQGNCNIWYVDPVHPSGYPGSTMFHMDGITGNQYLYFGLPSAPWIESIGPQNYAAPSTGISVVKRSGTAAGQVSMVIRSLGGAVAQSSTGRGQYVNNTAATIGLGAVYSSAGTGPTQVFFDMYITRLLTTEEVQAVVDVLSPVYDGVIS